MLRSVRHKGSYTIFILIVFRVTVTVILNIQFALDFRYMERLWPTGPTSTTENVALLGHPAIGDVNRFERHHHVTKTSVNMYYQVDVTGYNLHSDFVVIFINMLIGWCMPIIALWSAGKVLKMPNWVLNCHFSLKIYDVSTILACVGFWCNWFWFCKIWRGLQEVTGNANKTTTTTTKTKEQNILKFM